MEGIASISFNSTSSEASFESTLSSNVTLSKASSASVGVENLYPALIECFGIIGLGYLAGRFKLLTPSESRGLGIFVGNFALPALIFGALSSIEMESVNWNFLLSILITKSIVFLGVIFITILINWGKSIEKAGLYAIFVTQTNDFALGYPIVLALYGQSHPQFPAYLYLLAPISLAILNPIAFILIEIGTKLKEGDGKENNYDKTHTGAIENDYDPSKNEIHTQTETIGREMEIRKEFNFSDRLKTVIQTALGIVKNPILAMTFAGIIFGTFVFKGEVPPAINNFLTTLGRAFSACALFSLGLGMVGKMKTLTNGSKVIGPFLLILIKIIVMPLIARSITKSLNGGESEAEVEEANQLSDFAFLLGTFPTAPTVYVIAVRYNLCADVMASAMVVCTFVSAPIMFVSAQLLAATANDLPEYDEVVKDQIQENLFTLSIISLIVVSWTIFLIFYSSKKWRYMPHAQTMVLLSFQALLALGVLLHGSLNISVKWVRILQEIVIMTGIYGARVNVCIIAFTLLMLTKGKASVISRFQPYLLVIGSFLPAVIVIPFVFCDQSNRHPSDIISNHKHMNFGTASLKAAILVYAISLLVVVICLVLSQMHYKKRKNGNSDPRKSSISKLKSGESVLAVGKKVSDMLGFNEALPEGAALEDCCQWKDGRKRSKYERDCQMVRHTVLLLFQSLLMFVGIVSCVINISEMSLTPILVMIKFLDAFLNFGQGIMTFAIFGLESQYVFTPFICWLHKARSIWKEPQELGTDSGIENAELSVTLKLIQFLARKKEVLFKNDMKRRGLQDEKTPKISDALQAPEHVMLNFCQY